MRYVKYSQKQRNLTTMCGGIWPQMVFPFADGIEAAAQAGITYVWQPGGSIPRCRSIGGGPRRALKMVLGGSRHFKH